jgi:hypothetical protein
MFFTHYQPLFLCHTISRPQSSLSYLGIFEKLYCHSSIRRFSSLLASFSFTTGWNHHLMGHIVTLHLFHDITCPRYHPRPIVALMRFLTLLKPSLSATFLRTNSCVSCVTHNRRLLNTSFYSV